MLQGTQVWICKNCSEGSPRDIYNKIQWKLGFIPNAMGAENFHECHSFVPCVSDQDINICRL